MQDSEILVVSIVDVNDNRPIFTSSSYRGEISENSPTGELPLQSYSFFITRNRRVLSESGSSPSFFLVSSQCSDVFGLLIMGSN